MLKTITLTAGQWSNPLASVGHHINVVLAAGTIKCLLRQGNDNFTTDLVSGMAFKTDTQYSSVQFYSETSQTLKVWLGMVPLTYSPIDGRLLGSQYLTSANEKLDYKNPRELLAYQGGRQKVVMSAKKPFKVGGVGVNDDTAITVPANTNFALETQGAIWAYSGSPDDKLTLLSNITPPLSVDSSENGGARTKFFFMRPLESDKLLFRQAQGWFELNSDKTYRNITTTRGHCRSIAQTGDGTFYLDGYDSIKRVKYNADTEQFDEQTLHGVSRPRAIAAKRDGSKIAYVDETYNLYISDGETANNLGSELFVANDKFPYFLCYTNTNRLLYIMYDQYVYSDDDGQTWSAVKSMVSGHTEGGYYNGYTHDVIDNYLYYTAGDYKIYRSIDDGDTWQPIFDAKTYINAIYAEAGFVLASSNERLIVSTDSGETFSDNDLATGTGDNVSVMIGNDGKIYGSKNSAKLETYLSTGEKVARGGLNVNLLIEHN